MSESADIRVLVVDDNPEIRFMLRMWFERDGIEVVDEVGNYEEAVEKLNSTDINAVTIDNQMPRSAEDGTTIDAALDLAELAISKNISRIALITSSDLGTDPILENPCVRFFKKPARISEAVEFLKHP